MDEAREVLVPAVDAMRRALDVVCITMAEKGAEHMLGEIERASEEPVKMAAVRVDTAARSVLGEGFIPQTLIDGIRGRNLSWAGVTEETLLGQIETVVRDRLTFGSGNMQSIGDELDSLFRGWVADGTLDPKTGEELLKAWKVESIVRTSSMNAYNAGRVDMMLDPDVADMVATMRYSAILDPRTSPFCRAWHGKEIANLPENRDFLQELNPPGHVHCRSILVPVTIWETPRPTPISELPDLQPQMGFGSLNKSGLRTHSKEWDEAIGRQH
jgi:SPP1 gp7 family putative phage head morphogenesis protein